MAVWLGYFILHSALASITTKIWVRHRFPCCTPYYRLTYNLLAILLLLPPLWLAHIPSYPSLWAWQGNWFWLANGLALAAAMGFIWSLRYYDTRAFLGLTPQGTADQTTRFTLSPLHRYVRHPWYSLALVILWTRDMNSAWLVSCIAITLYFIVGSRLEERKLVGEFGEAYRRYQQLVPSLLPLPGRYLTHAEITKLIAISREKLE